jgi:hypothetical protein
MPPAFDFFNSAVVRLCGLSAAIAIFVQRSKRDISVPD